MQRPTSIFRPPLPVRSSSGGFTLVEVMITVAVAAALLGLGAPSMLRLMARHAVAGQADEWLNTLRFARSEAMKRGGPVVLCRTDPLNGGACSSDTRVGWQTWTMFADVARTGVLAPGDPVLRDQSQAPARVVVSSDIHLDAVRFEPTGIALATLSGNTAASNVVFVLDAARPRGTQPGGEDLAARRQVCLSSRGTAVAINGGAVCP